MRFSVPSFLLSPDVTKVPISVLHLALCTPCAGDEPVAQAGARLQIRMVAWRTGKHVLKPSDLKSETKYVQGFVLVQMQKEYWQRQVDL